MERPAVISASPPARTRALLSTSSCSRRRSRAAPPVCLLPQLGSTASPQRCESAILPRRGTFHCSPLWHTCPTPPTPDCTCLWPQAPNPLSLNRAFPAPSRAIPWTMSWTRAKRRTSHTRPTDLLWTPIERPCSRPECPSLKKNKKNNRHSFNPMLPLPSPPSRPYTSQSLVHVAHRGQGRLMQPLSKRRLEVSA